MCIPGLITNPNTQGIYKLLKNGATLTTCADDILSVLEWEGGQKKLELSTTQEFDTEESKIMSLLEIEEKSFDELLQLSTMDIDTLLTNLTLLEIKGIIKRVNGDRYRKEV